MKHNSKALTRGIDPNDLMDWLAHAHVYRTLGHIAKTEAAERYAKELGG